MNGQVIMPIWIYCLAWGIIGWSMVVAYNRGRAKGYRQIQDDVLEIIQKISEEDVNRWNRERDIDDELEKNIDWLEDNDER